MMNNRHTALKVSSFKNCESVFQNFLLMIKYSHEKKFNKINSKIIALVFMNLSTLIKIFDNYYHLKYKLKLLFLMI